MEFGSPALDPPITKSVPSVNRDGSLCVRSDITASSMKLP